MSFFASLRSAVRKVAPFAALGGLAIPGVGVAAATAAGVFSRIPGWISTAGSAGQAAVGGITSEIHRARTGNFNPAPILPAGAPAGAVGDGSRGGPNVVAIGGALVAAYYLFLRKGR